MSEPEDIVIIKEVKMITGQIAVLYYRKGESDLKRIKIKGDDK